MKKILIHTVPVLVSLIWIIVSQHSYNPISLKGPDFLRFYLLHIGGFYSSIFISKNLQCFDYEIVSCFMILIMILGIVKLLRGISLHKPIGFLVIILIFEAIIILIFMLSLKDGELRFHKKR